MGDSSSLLAVGVVIAALTAKYFLFDKRKPSTRSNNSFQQQPAVDSHTLHSATLSNNSGSNTNDEVSISSSGNSAHTQTINRKGKSLLDQYNINIDQEAELEREIEEDKNKTDWIDDRKRREAHMLHQRQQMILKARKQLLNMDK
ncbi:hypothetical protein DASB73_030030 [Starmerella bacillaris]|uniref:Uncharacterized protein n=1 Tax=Starmerella bacillaris TaxID=1247836 RepID=A0AAV5RKW5_STABA|nr:hypothetical protein DASB73_030030 [Starmerella bacillaris]